jgi:predicted permease
LILLAVAGVVLLLACINLASLQTARSAARRREIAVRLSLGAGRKRILRQLLIESLLLAAMGAGAGAMLATWGARLIASLLTIGPAFDAVWLDLSPDLRILAFTLFAAAFTSVAFGLAPAWQATRVDIAPTLKDEVRGVTRRSAWSAGKALIAGQAALSLALLTGAGLFLRTLANLYGLDAGFVRDRLLLFRLDPGQLGRKPEQVRPEYDAILRSIAATPGVRSAAAMSHWLIGGWRNSTRLSSDETGWQPVDVMMNTVSPGFFETVGMPIVAGRAFLPQDSSLSRPAVILNQSAARRLCGERPAVGQVLNRQTTGSPYPVEVIGVARDAKFESLRSPTEPTVFVLFPSSYPATGRSFAVRTAGDPLTMVESIRGAISAIDRDLVMMNVKTETGLIDESLHQERLFTNLLTLSGCFALLLAAIGLYGVTAYSMARRTAEIGLRMALGAGRGRVLWLIVGQALRPVAAGTLAGFAVSLAATRWIESLLFGVRRFDPLTMGAVFSALVAVALAAAFVPAWRATHIDPMEALRYE